MPAVLKRSISKPLVTCLLAVVLQRPVWGGQYPQFGSPQSTAQSAPTRVAGRVVNAVNGAPVSRALVRCNNRAMLTDQEGKFQFEQVTESAANFQVQKPGYAASSDPQEQVVAYYQTAQIDGPLEFKLYPEAILTGTVTGPEGDPLSRMPVTARRGTVDETGRHWTPMGQTQTNERGEFRIPVPAGDYRLETRYMPRGNQGVVSATGREAVLPVSVPASTSGSSPQAIHLRNGEEQRFDLRPGVRKTYPVAISTEGLPNRDFPQITARPTNGPSFQVGVMPSRNGGGATLFLPTGSYRLTARAQLGDSVATAETSVTVTGAERTGAEKTGAEKTGAERAMLDGAASSGGGAVLRFVATATIPVELSTDSAATVTPANTVSFPPPARGQSSGGVPTPMQLGLMLVPADSDSDAAQGDEGTQAAGQSVSVVQSRNSVPGFSITPGHYRLVARGFSPWFIESATAGTTDLLAQGLTVTAGSANAPIRLVVDNRTGSLESDVLLKGKPPASCWIYLIAGGAGAGGAGAGGTGAGGTGATPLRTQRCANGGYLPSMGFLPPGSYQAIAFEHRVGIDLTNPANLLPFAGYAQTVTIAAGGKTTVKLNAVPEQEGLR